MRIRAVYSPITTVLMVALTASTFGQTPSATPAQRAVYKPQPGDFVVVCTLFKGRAPGADDSTPVEPVTYDPRFELGARIERIAAGESPWRPGELVTFVIHSPTLTVGRDFAGKQFELTFSRFRPTKDEDKVWFMPATRFLLQWIDPARTENR